MKSKLWKFLAILIILTLLVPTLAGCSNDKDDKDEPSASVEDKATEEPKEPVRKVATFIWTQEFDTMNPIYSAMWFTSITTQIWNAAAWDFDENSNPHPVLVTEMPSLENGGLSEDGTVITMKLRDDIVWSDNAPITADDFVFTYEMTVNPANTVASTYPYDLIKNVQAPDDHTVVITFEEPFVAWAATLWTYVLPAHVLRPVFESDGTLDDAAWNRKPSVSAGPFVFKEWESGSYARFEINENYYGTKPNITEIYIRFVPDDASQLNALRTGDGDLGTFIAYSDVPTLDEENIQILAVPSGYNEGWFIHFGENAHPALADKRVRQAIAMAFDRQKLCKDLLLGLTKPPSTYWDNTPFANPAIEAWPYDPQAAKQLLEQAGWVDSNGDGIREKDGEDLVLVHGTTSRQIRQDTQAVAQEQLREVGIDLKLQSYASDLYFASYGEGGPCATGELDICESSTNPSFPDPETSRWRCDQIPTDEYPDGSNWQWLCDEELDKLYQLQSTQIDVQERQQTFYKIGEIMHDNVYWLGIWQDPDIWAISSRLTNAKISGVTPFYSIAEWDIVE